MGLGKFVPGILPEIGVQLSGRIQPSKNLTKGIDQGILTSGAWGVDTFF